MESINKSEKKTIEYNHKQYPIRYLDIPEYGNNLKISTLSLQNALLDFDFAYKSEEAQIIDKEIFYYVTSDEMLFPDNLLIKHITNNL